MGKEPEEAEEEGQWKGRERTMTKGRRIGRDDDDENDYTPPHPESEAAAAPSDSELVIPFAFGGKEAVETVVDKPISLLPSSPGVIYFSSYERIWR